MGLSKEREAEGVPVRVGCPSTPLTSQGFPALPVGAAEAWPCRTPGACSQGISEDMGLGPQVWPALSIMGEVKVLGFPGTWGQEVGTRGHA